MFSIDILLQMVLPMIGALLIKPASAAKYAKWLIRIRNYLTLLFPVDTYPVDWKDTNIDSTKAKQYKVPESAVTAEAKKRGFNVPFIKGV